ncbi:NAD-dependent protein deacetylase hst4 [Grifola frondosa]|uniref:NAD-dependent protein deacetylase hst4 n=1 Tax=Grifola frondosa TaxID=5627 RepID=A0A1C7M7C9_GRIFR|nr:NAD-dependent protein deacetylase hst4 [Grifola frondosa]
MTVFLPLEASSPFPQSPSFLVPSSDPSVHLKKVIKAIMKARRIAVVCGAGISVQAGIPDFRSSEGLFHSLKKDNPTLSSGKDLFDAMVFNSETTTSLFCQMIAQLSELSQAAMPTAFHKLLRVLDDRGRLLRVYTQNIDALEEKSGLTFGVPELDCKRAKPRSTKGKTIGVEMNVMAVEQAASTSRLPSPPLKPPDAYLYMSMHCQTCTHSFPLRDHLPALVSGTPPHCPECTALEETRQLIGKRSRGVGKLRPSVVLYNEVHKDGEEVGNVVRKDLIGNSKGKGRAGADLLLVVGTSLRVPGTKRIVREFSKAVHSRSTAASPSHGEASTSTSTTTSGLATPTPSPRRTPTADEEPPIKTVYLNLDFPVPTREWEGVFDVWVRGDVQTFAQMVRDELDKENSAKEAAIERRKRREEAAEKAKLQEEQRETSSPSKGKKRKAPPGEALRAAPAKKYKALPPSPISLPKRTSTKTKKHKRNTDVLPTATSSTGSHKGDMKLVIRIPGDHARPSRRRIHLSACASCRRLARTISGTTQLSSPLSSPPASPLIPPPSSPLTPAPSPSPHRRTMSFDMASTRPEPIRRYHDYDDEEEIFGWDDQDDLTDVSDNSDDLRLPEPAQYRLRGPTG